MPDAERPNPFGRTIVRCRRCALVLAGCTCLEEAVASRYAEKTSVPSSRTAAEIGELVRRHGAKQFVAGWDDARNQAAVEFILAARRVRFLLSVPDRRDREFTHTPARMPVAAPTVTPTSRQVTRIRADGLMRGGWLAECCGEDGDG